MKLNAAGFTALAILSSVIYYGCVVVDNKRAFDPGAVLGLTALDRSLEKNRARLTKVTVEVEAGKCRASFDTDLNDGTVRAKSGKVLPGSDPDCRIEEPPGQLEDLLMITTKAGPRPLKSISAVQFRYEGSCRDCWKNSNGQQTCVRYPPPC
jgi:hypothetical protein